MLLFVRQSTLFAQHLDLKRGELTGSPIAVADHVSEPSSTFAGVSASDDGHIAYRAGMTGFQMTWVDRTGKALNQTGGPILEYMDDPALSPNEEQVAITRFSPGNLPNIWILELLRGGLTRLTLDPDGSAVTPVWSPDGRRIAFSSRKKGSALNIYWKSSSGMGAEELLLDRPSTKDVSDWSKDGRFILYWERDNAAKSVQDDLWALPADGNDRKPIPIATTLYDERNGQFSPDGKWVAYETDETGRFEIVVQQFPEPAAKSQISTNGGSAPRWSADGKELYFIAPDNKLMAASIRVVGNTLKAGTPIGLFTTRLTPNPTKRQQYAVSRDGRFLLNQPAESSSNSPITLILNWKPKE
jgi:dipeptidyl aminopeptidase/acylaminoacyl peptidase